MNKQREPPTNGSYKIRQIIIKIVGCSIYIYMHKQNQNSSTKNKVQQIDQVNKGNQNLYLSVKNKTNKHKLENKTKARCQVGNKAMKTKLTIMLRGNEERKERIDMQLNRGR